MRIIAVDDEELALDRLMTAIQQAAPGAELHGFFYPEDALAFLQGNGCDVAFLDVEMADVSGVELARQLLLEGRSVTDVAMELGFSSSNYFSSVFRRYTAMSPTQYLAANGKDGT